MFVVCHHLGADGVPGLYGGCAIRVQLRLGRCHVSLPTKYTPKVTRDTSQMPPLILTARSTAAHSNVLSQVVHVYLFKGSSARCVILSCSLRNAGPHSFAFLPCNTSAGCRRVWYPATSSVLDVRGANFGADRGVGELGGGIVIVVGGVRCVAVDGGSGGSVFVNDTLLRCRMSAPSSVGPKNVSVFVGGQWAEVSPSLEVVALCGSGFKGVEGRSCSHLSTQYGFLEVSGVVLQACSSRTFFV